MMMTICFFRKEFQQVQCYPPVLDWSCVGEVFRSSDCCCYAVSFGKLAPRVDADFHQPQGNYSSSQFAAGSISGFQLLAPICESISVFSFSCIHN